MSLFAFWRVNPIRSLKGGNIMAKTKLEAKRRSPGKNEPASKQQVSNRKKTSPSCQQVGGWTPQDQSRYGAAPLLPHESHERYSQINKWLEPGIGGYQSRFENHLK